MFQSLARTLWMLTLALLFATPLPADDKAGSTAETQKTVRAILAKFDKGDPGWKVRMEALVSLAKIGPTAGPILVEGLKHKSPEIREFAAQALVLFADSKSQPALERALADPKPGARLYAIQALSMLGPLARTKEHERILKEDPAFFGVRPMMAAALERADRPNQADMRKQLAEYDLRKIDSARIGELAPDLTLTNFSGKTYRLSEFRGKQTVVLRFILFDYWWRTGDTFAQLRGRDKEYKRRDVQPLVVMAQQPFQLKRPKQCDKEWSWHEEIPAEVVFDPLATVSATYGVAFQTQFRGKQNVWSSRPTIFVIDQSGVLRHVASHHNEDIREEGIFPILDELEEQRKLIAALGAKDEEQREAVRAVLAPPGPRTGKAIPALVKSLKSEDARLRTGAAAALLWVAPRAEEAVPAITGALKDKDARVRSYATMALGRLGGAARPSVATLVHGLTDEDQRVRTETLAALERIGPDAGVGLQQALKDTDPRIRAAAAQALPRFREQAESSFPVLLEALKDDDAGVRVAVLNAMRVLPVREDVKKPAIPALTAALKDKDAQVREAAATCIPWLGTYAKEAVVTLIEALHDQASPVRTSAANTLAWISKDAGMAIPALIEMLKDKQANVRASAAWALRGIGPVEGADIKAEVQALIAAVKDPDTYVRRESAAALARIVRPGTEDKAAVQPLMETLKDKNPDVRGAVAAALGALGPDAKSAIRMLVKALEDENPGVRVAVSKALGAIGPEADVGVPAFIAALKDEHHDVRRLAAQALGQFGTAAKAAVPALIEVLKDENGAVRQEAAHALRKIDPEAAKKAGLK